MRKYRRITYEERIRIEALSALGYSARYVALLLGRSHNSISYELRKKVKNIYTAKKAQHKTYQRRYSVAQDSMKVVSLGLERTIEELVRKRWSPERISGYLRLNQVNISKNAIYHFVYKSSLDWFLVFRGRKRYKKIGRIEYLKGLRKYVDQRDICTSTGHYEMDFIVSSHSKYVLLVVVDRYSRYTRIRLLQNRKHATVTRALREIFSGLHIRSITTDNDIAFSHWKQLENILNTNIYFTYPYHSWEKGLVENTNRWIRLFVPKKTDLKRVTKEDIHDIHTFLNDSPRQILGYRSTTEVELEARVY
jgi:transposase, IS30 family